MRFPAATAADYQSALQGIVEYCAAVFEQVRPDIERVLETEHEKLLSLGDAVLIDAAILGQPVLIGDAAITLNIAEILKYLKTIFAKALRGDLETRDTVQSFIRRVLLQQKKDLKDRAAQLLRMEAQQGIMNLPVGRELEAMQSALAGSRISRPSLAGYRKKYAAAGMDIMGSLSATGEEITESMVSAGIEENVALIKSIPEQLHGKVQSIIMEGVTKGESTATIAEKLRAIFPQAYKKCEFIARDQAGKFYGTMTRVRMMDNGFKTFIWSTMKDDRVRDSHAALEGKVFTWEEGWNGIFPGQEPGCRCVPEVNPEELGVKARASVREPWTAPEASYYPSVLSKQTGKPFTVEQMKSAGYGPPPEDLMKSGDVELVIEDAYRKLQGRDYEGLYIIDPNTGAVLGASAGTQGNAALPAGVDVKGKILVHNHPSGWALSGSQGDLEVLIGRGLKEIHAVCSSGDVYVARNTEESLAKFKEMGLSEWRARMQTVENDHFRDPEMQAQLRAMKEAVQDDPVWQSFMKESGGQGNYGITLPKPVIERNRNYHDALNQRLASEFGFEWEKRASHLAPVYVLPGEGKDIKYGARWNQPWLKNVTVAPELDLGSSDEYQRFIKAMEAQVPKGYEHFVTYYTEEQYREKGARLFLSPSGKSGYALFSSGELASVFSSEHCGEKMLREGVERGGEWLECFEGRLSKELYPRVGFTVTSEMKWDDQYAPAGWDYARFGRPSVVTMRLVEAAKPSSERIEEVARLTSSGGVREAAVMEDPEDVRGHIGTGYDHWGTWGRRWTPLNESVLADVKTRDEAVKALQERLDSLLMHQSTLKGRLEERELEIRREAFDRKWDADKLTTALSKAEDEVEDETRQGKSSIRELADSLAAIKPLDTSGPKITREELVARMRSGARITPAQPIESQKDLDNWALYAGLESWKRNNELMKKLLVPRAGDQNPVPMRMSTGEIAQARAVREFLDRAEPYQGMLWRGGFLDPKESYKIAEIGGTISFEKPESASMTFERAAAAACAKLPLNEAMPIVYEIRSSKGAADITPVEDQAHVYPEEREAILKPGVQYQVVKRRLETLAPEQCVNPATGIAWRPVTENVLVVTLEEVGAPAEGRSMMPWGKKPDPFSMFSTQVSSFSLTKEVADAPPQERYTRASELLADSHRRQAEAEAAMQREEGNIRMEGGRAIWVGPNNVSLEEIASRLEVFENSWLDRAGVLGRRSELERDVALLKPYTTAELKPISKQLYEHAAKTGDKEAYPWLQDLENWKVSSSFARELRNPETLSTQQRARAISRMRGMQEFLDAAEPEADMTVFRGLVLSPALRQQLIDEGEMTMEWPQSASAEWSTADELGDGNDIWIMKTKRGSCVSLGPTEAAMGRTGSGTLSKEKEVVIRAGTTFRLEKAVPRENAAPGSYEFHFYEV